MIRSRLRVLQRSDFVRDAGYLWVAEIVGLGIGLIQAVVLARLLGPSGYGLLALVVAVPTFLFTLIDPQSQEAVVKYLGESAREGRAQRALAVAKLAYLTDLALAASGLLLTVAVVVPAARFVVHDTSTTALIVAYALLLTSAAPTSTSRAVLITFGRFRSTATAQVGTSVARAAMVIFAAEVGGVSGVVIASGAALVLEAAVTMVLAHRLLQSELAESWHRAPLAALGDERRPIVRFMVFTELSSLASVFVKQADILILGALGTSSQVGFYRLARTTGTLVASLVSPLQSAAYPRFVRDGRAGERAVAATGRRALLFVGLPLAVLTLALLPLLPAAIRLLAGQAFVPATAAAQVFLAGSAFSLAFFWVRPAILALGRVRFLFVTSATTVALALAGFLLLAGEHGALGVAAVRALLVSVASNIAAAAYLAYRATNQRAHQTHVTT